MEKETRGEKNKRLKGGLFLPMTPLKTLRTAQLFQISWPRISSTVGNLKGSIGGLSASFGLAESFVDSFPVPEAMDVARIGSGKLA